MGKTYRLSKRSSKASNDYSFNQEANLESTTKFNQHLKQLKREKIKQRHAQKREFAHEY